MNKNKRIRSNDMRGSMAFSKERNRIIQRSLTVILFVAWSSLVVVAPAGEVLYNGIELPEPWPPQLKELTPAENTDPATPYYLQKPPAIIPIDVGRQLFVDDFLVESTTLKRSMHKLEPYAENPILRPDQPWESKGKYSGYRGSYAMPFSDGVWYDPEAKCFKMWYMGGVLFSTCYATSRDGLKWTKPVLDVVPGTNIVHPSKGATNTRDANTIWLDLDDPNPAQRYKMFRTENSPKRGFVMQFSADGVHWGEEIRRAGFALDRTTVFYNPFRKVWVYSIKGMYPKYKAPGAFQVRRYWEASDLLQSPMWSSDDASSLPWVNTDRLDPPLIDRPGQQAYIYNLDGVAYESLILGMFTIHQRYADKEKGQPKKNEVFLGFSRDGFCWHRPLREPFVGISETKGDWNWGNVQSVGGCCLIVGDKLYFYYSGRGGTGRLPNEESFFDADASTGVGFLRRDGFASMDAGAAEETLLTRPVRFHGKHLFVNAAAEHGALQVEILDQHNKVIEPFGRANCKPISDDRTSTEVRWNDTADLSALAGKPVKFRFYLRHGSLYAFWVSPEASGASHGYVAAGGPGFTGPIDTVGQKGD